MENTVVKRDAAARSIRIIAENPASAPPAPPRGMTRHAVGVGSMQITAEYTDEFPEPRQIPESAHEARLVHGSRRGADRCTLLLPAPRLEKPNRGGTEEQRLTVLSLRFGTLTLRVGEPPAPSILTFQSDADAPYIPKSKIHHGDFIEIDGPGQVELISVRGAWAVISAYRAELKQDALPAAVGIRQ
jgi:hypothetical protein